MTWSERLVHDASLRAFVNGQRGQDAVELAALRVEHAHLQDVVAAQQRRIQELEPAPEKLRKKARS